MGEDYTHDVNLGGGVAVWRAVLGEPAQRTQYHCKAQVIARVSSATHNYHSNEEKPEQSKNKANRKRLALWGE